MKMFAKQPRQLTIQSKLNGIKQYNEQICATDGECVQLKQIFMRAFGVASRLPTDDDDLGKERVVDEPQESHADTMPSPSVIIVSSSTTNTSFSEELMDQFEDPIYPLVRRITNRLDPSAVHCVWVDSCQVVAAAWSSKLSAAKTGLDLLHYLLGCWHAYQSGCNMIHSLAVYAQDQLLSKQASPCPALRSRSQINEICCAVFVDHFLASYKSHDDEEVKKTTNEDGVEQDLEWTMTTEEITTKSTIYSSTNRQLIFDSLMSVISSTDIDTDTDADASEPVQTVCAVLGLLQYLDARNHTVYYRVFVLPYLAALQQAHNTEPCLTTAAEVITYLERAESIINREVSLANLFHFTAPFVRMLGKVLYSELVAQHRELICSFGIFAEFVQSGLVTSMNYLYRMVGFDAESRKLIAANIERFVLSQLESIPMPEYKNGPCSADEVKRFVMVTARLHTIWLSQIMPEIFEGCPTARAAIVSAFTTHLNSSPVHGCLLATFVHLTSIDSSDWSPETAITLLAYVEDKQTISEYARYFLCSRILHHLVKDAEQDVAMVGRQLDTLQIESPFSVKLILKNYKTSVHQVKDAALDRYKQPFQVRLLNGLWKLDTDSTSQTFRLPRSFWLFYNSFCREFAAKNPKRSLTLNRKYGSAKMLARFNTGRTTYQFVVSLRQTVVLLLFNRHTRLSYSDLQARTKMDSESLTGVLALFERYSLIRKVKPVSMQTEKEEMKQDCDTDSITLEPEFTSHSFEINDSFNHKNVNKAALCLSVGKTDTDRPALVTVNWIKLQHQCHPVFDLVKIMAKCSGDDESSDGGAVEAGGGKAADAQTKAAASSDVNGGEGAVSGKSSKPAHATTSKRPSPSTSTKPSKHDRVEANLFAGTFRLEAAVVRVLKRATVVADLKTLHSLTLEALGKTAWAGAVSPRKLAASVSLVDLQKCVESLEKNGYLLRMASGEFFYVP